MANASAAPRVEWDYTEHASHYDKRADYSETAVQQLLQIIGCKAGDTVADVGAGTGKLTKELLKHGLRVRSVEPNRAMREIGVQNTRGATVEWSVGTGESTGLPDHGFSAVLFGSSFNVVDQARTLTEVRRILQPRGWFACMWNHRDLDDSLQLAIESVIKSHIPAYSYGLRREDPRSVIDASGYFSAARALEGRFTWRMTRADIVEAWRSHATLKRQAGDEGTFNRIIREISARLESEPAELDVPYTTRIYYAQLLPNAQ